MVRSVDSATFIGKGKEVSVAGPVNKSVKSFYSGFFASAVQSLQEALPSGFVQVLSAVGF